jgi:RHS repeat-associated protein
MEKDDEIKGSGNSYDYVNRFYDNRLARFLSVDAIAQKFPWNSPYSYAENDVIRCVDIDGREKLIIIYHVGKDGVVGQISIVNIKTLHRVGISNDLQNKIKNIIPNNFKEGIMHIYVNDKKILYNSQFKQGLSVDNLSFFTYDIANRTATADSWYPRQSRAGAFGAVDLNMGDQTTEMVQLAYSETKSGSSNTFSYASYNYGFDIDKTANPIITKEIAELYATNLINDPFFNLSITGHTDPVGTNAYNNDLSTRRANEAKNNILTAVEEIAKSKNIIINKEEISKRIQTSGKGEKELIKNADGTVNDAASRRVEIKAYVKVNE